jgi:phage tail-like protein
MRGALPRVSTPHPIGEWLPAVYLEDEFTQRFTAALDDVFAPVFLTLDCAGSYFDPQLAPDDFLDWLAGWVAVDIDESWTVEQRRALVAHAVELHRRRGTRRGLAIHVYLLTGGEVEVIDSGGCSSSDEPNQPLPGTSPAEVTVRVRVSDPATVDTKRLRAAVREAVPAHVKVAVEVEPMGEE